MYRKGRSLFGISLLFGRLHGHGHFGLVQHGVVHLQLSGLTILEELRGNLREHGVAEHVFFLLVVVADLLAIL